MQSQIWSICTDFSHRNTIIPNKNSFSWNAQGSPAPIFAEIGTARQKKRRLLRAAALLMELLSTQVYGNGIGLQSGSITVGDDALVDSGGAGCVDVEGQGLGVVTSQVTHDPGLADQADVVIRLVPSETRKPVM